MRGCSCRGTAGFAHVSCLGGAGEDFGRGGRGEHLAPMMRDGGTVGNVQPVRATVPWCRALRAQLGVLEGVRGPAGGETLLGLLACIQPAWERFIRRQTITRTCCPCKEAELAMKRRMAVTDRRHSRRAGQSCENVFALGRFEEALPMDREVYSGTFEALGWKIIETLIEASHVASISLVT